VLGGGDRLGLVVGRIVGEVLVGILDADPESFRVVDPGWRPTLPAAESGGYGLADLPTTGGT
jgi:hypothetical protein